MKQSLNDLEELAESIGLINMVNGRVDLINIINNLRILIVEGHYGKGFLGLLICEENQFYIQVNLDELENRPGRLRFTLAHELGHYFTDDHRIKLQNGISMSFLGDPSQTEDKFCEKQANYFASALLMPNSIFLEEASKYEPGLETILALKGSFDTSIESTIIKYTQKNIIPCMAIKWKSDLSFDKVYYSQSLSDMTGIRYRPPIKTSKSYISEILSQLNFDFQIYESATQLSKWVASIPPGSKRDLVGLEQTIKIGKYGAITFLIFSPE